jgi:hypothetical protein
MSAPLDSLSARFKDGKSKRETPELQPAIVNARLKPAITPHAPRAYSDQNATRIPDGPLAIPVAISKARWR